MRTVTHYQRIPRSILVREHVLNTIIGIKTIIFCLRLTHSLHITHWLRGTHWYQYSNETEKAQSVPDYTTFPHSSFSHHGILISLSSVGLCLFSETARKFVAKVTTIIIFTTFVTVYLPWLPDFGSVASLARILLVRVSATLLLQIGGYWWLRIWKFCEME
jgi:hypothetical protein